MKTQRFHPKDWVRKHPLLARMWTVITVLIVIPLGLPTISLADACRKGYRYSRGGFFRAFVSSFRNGLSIWKEEAVGIIRRWEFLDS